MTTEYNRAVDRPEFFGFARRDTVFSFNPEGGVISRKLAWPEEPAVCPVTAGLEFTLPFRPANTPRDVVLPLGLVIVSGATAGGKTSFVKALSRKMPLVRLRTVEPHDDPDELSRLPAFHDADTALAVAVHGTLVSRKSPVLYAIDSLRAPLFETGGAAGTKGISMPFFTQITRVSNALAQAGVTVLATVNPMDEDPAYVASFLGKLSASVPGMITINSSTGIATDSETFTGTVSLRPRRDPRPFTWQVAASVPAPDSGVTEIAFTAESHGVEFTARDIQLARIFRQADDADTRTFHVF